MRTSRTFTFLAGAILAAALPAAAQPAPAPPPSGRVLSVTFGATPPASATFHGVCAPPVRITFQGVVTTDVAIPDKKRVSDQFRIVWSDALVREPEGRTSSADRKQTTLTAGRSFDKSFNGWVLLQANPWGTTHPHNSAQVAVKVTCESPVYKQLQRAPTGSSKAPSPPAGPGH